MTEFQTGAVRDTGGKGRMDLLPWCALLRVSKHMEDAILPDPETGQPHYPERNWEKGIPMHSMIDSAFRHLAKYVDGWNDEDHLCSAATNLLMAMWMEEKMPSMQDIPSKKHPNSQPNSQPNNVDINLTPLEEEGLIESSIQICHCYDAQHFRCNGTREREICKCRGNKEKCDFYEKES